jgi:hypothetical protein
MFCVRCGSPVQGSFCTHCGAPAQTPASAPPPIVHPPRVQQHLQTLGILWCVYGAYRGVVVIFILLFLMGISVPAFLGGMGQRAEQFLPFAAVIGGLAALAGVFILISSCLSIATGYSLLKRKPWGRTLALVAGILSLMEVPLGTGLGVFTLWVLIPAASGAEYDAIADRT